MRSEPETPERHSYRNTTMVPKEMIMSGEFVDMTLAADGHFVKVHQVIVALASPFIKQLLASAPCPHPILFLNKISYTTLCSLLEYIYTGQVYVAVEDLMELCEAAKELHIKGLEDMKIPDAISTPQHSEYMTDNQTRSNDCTMETLDDEVCYFEISNSEVKEEKQFITPSQSLLKTKPERSPEESVDEAYEDSQSGIEEVTDGTVSVSANSDTVNNDNSHVTVMQYTVSNQGSLQMILNRYIYYLKHTNRNNSQQWRCVDYLNNIKCPALVLTENGVVILRISAHTHPFHDKRILKKVHAGAVFSAIQDAERQGINIKRSRGYDETEPNNE